FFITSFATAKYWLTTECNLWVKPGATATSWGSIKGTNALVRGLLSAKLKNTAHHPAVAQAAYDVLKAMNSTLGKAGGGGRNRRNAFTIVVEAVALGNRPDGKTEIGVAALNPFLAEFKTLGAGQAAHGKLISILETLAKDEKAFSAYFRSSF